MFGDFSAFSKKVVLNTFERTLSVLARKPRDFSSDSPSRCLLSAQPEPIEPFDIVH